MPECTLDAKREESGRSATVRNRDPLAVAMSGVRLGERVLQIGGMIKVIGLVAAKAA